MGSGDAPLFCEGVVGATHRNEREPIDDLGSQRQRGTRPAEQAEVDLTVTDESSNTCGVGFDQIDLDSPYRAFGQPGRQQVVGAIDRCGKPQLEGGLLPE